MNGYSFYERASAIVVDVDDPEKRGRIRVRCAAVCGADEIWDEWALPQFPTAGNGHGWFFLPNPGDVVEVVYLAGMTSDSAFGQSFIFNPRLRWVAAHYGSTSDVPSEFAGDNYRRRYGISLDDGTVFVMDRERSEISMRASKVRLGTLSGGEPVIGGSSAEVWVGDLVSAIESLRGAVDSLADVVGGLHSAAAVAGVKSLLVAVEAELSSVESSFSDTHSNVATVAMSKE